MKTITVRLEGHVEVFLLEKTDVLDAETIAAYDYMTELADDGMVDENMIEVAFMKDIESLTYSVDDGEYVDIVKKGKYIVSNDYLKRTYGMEMPFVVQHSDSCYADFEYVIELNDDEEFDPMKLQLEKSNYEVGWLPYGIITNHIMYDNRMIYNQLEKCFDIYAESGCFLYDTFECGRQF